jgi:hypothetical protein
MRKPVTGLLEIHEQDEAGHAANASADLFKCHRPAIRLDRTVVNHPDQFGESSMRNHAPQQLEISIINNCQSTGAF